MTKQYKRVASLNPRRSVFNLSYEKKFTADMGQLIPVMCDEVVPGDVFKLGSQAVIRFQPLVAPVLHEINMYVHYYFVPYRLLWDHWENFITGGVNGTDTSVLPRWSPTNYAVNSLWDYLGFPLLVPTGALPIDFPRRAYNLVYNEYYRDETLQVPIALTNESILVRNWEKDYFTSSLPWQQRGPAPALPITGTTSAHWTSNNVQNNTINNPINVNSSGSDPRFYVNGAGSVANTLLALNSNSVDLSTASAFDIADLRLAFQIQKWMERNARAGVRYTEFLRGHFGVSPRDDRLQRPEYIGGSKSPVIVSEVLQTSSTDTTTPQGNMAGHGISVNDAYCGSYRADEFGLIIGIMSVMPKPAYQQGIDRQWLRRTKYDFYFPEFCNLSEQAIERAELYASTVDAENLTIFGYQGRYDELRVKRNMVVSEMRSTYDYWHLARQFSTPPLLNESFVQCVPRKDIFAVQNVPGLIVSFANLIKAIRPLPVTAEPGLIDHN